ncbi:efflux RND transporter permease subunit [Brumicola pallidula]|jgi:multidrug efflux pump subunit AcrB|uniref:AcrB/AcrD/AcrF family protein n=1 Tax=Brumicola pallidula DSM 14239 = ACAM 615 TaxID=1121922 RepID=K6ZIL3_9ALTE|nr:efflux RND transporter permease subunit [Glaciecola pallidula]GAC28743.1 AcrB/AcrD/AcrF family protein [Glaciecola pallidula DSM 14239 = ACAM 615]
MPTAQHNSPWYTTFFRRGHLLALSIIIILVAGLSAVTNLPRLEDPRIDLRNVIILTSYPGASAERVEALVSDVLEDELRELYEIKEIKSTSKAGFSSVLVELQDWVDDSTNQQIFSKIRDSLENASVRLPVGASKPILEDKRGATAFTMLISIDADMPETTSLSVSGRLASELVDRVRNVPGTELVRLYGNPIEEVVVALDPQALAAVGLSIGQVSERIRTADSKLPAGILRTSQKNIRVQVAEPLESLDIIANIPLVAADGSYLRLADVATIEQSWQTPEREFAIVDGQRTIFMAARMQTTVRVDQWTEAVNEKVTDFNNEFNGTAQANIVFEQNEYTQARLTELTENLLLGSVVVMLVILVFMGAKASWIVGLALPLCAAFAIFSLSFFDQQIHQMSIFGIIIAIGLLIDNAIVITDEIRLNLLDQSTTRLQALEKSVKHLFAPLLASTLTTVLGFMPIFLLTGNIGDFIGAIAISVVMALLGSLAISLTIIAALAARYLPRDGTSEHAWYRRGWQMPAVSYQFSRLLGRLIKQPSLVLSVIVVFCLSGFVLSQQLPSVFFPSADRDQFEIYVWLPNGTSINQTKKVALSIDVLIRDKQEVQQVTWLVGASTPSIYYNQVMSRDNSPEFANAVVTTNSISQAAALIPTLQYELQDAYPNARIVVRAFGQGPPIPAPIEVDVFGPDIDTLNALGEQIRLAMTKVPGITQTIATITTGEPELQYDVSENDSYIAQLSLTDIAQQLQLALAGTTGGSILQGTEELPVRVRVNENQRSDMKELDAMPLMNQALMENRASIGVASLGQFTLLPSISGITRVDGERVNKVQAFLLPGVPAIDASEQLRELLENGNFVLPKGYRLKMAGDADEQKQALGQLATYAPVLLVLMVTVLILTFNSVRFAVVIAMVAILSVGLGMFSLWVSGLPIGFNPLLGSAGLIGVAINGSIVVIAAINGNAKAKSGDTRAIVEETMSCSRHILSTTFTTVGGLIPLLLFSQGSFWPPLAVVLAGGVGFSVILSLFFTPTIVALMCRMRTRKLQKRAHNTAHA